MGGGWGGGDTKSFGLVLTQELDVLAIQKRGWTIFSHAKGGGGGHKQFWGSFNMGA